MEIGNSCEGWQIHPRADRVNRESSCKITIFVATVRRWGRYLSTLIVMQVVEVGVLLIVMQVNNNDDEYREFSCQKEIVSYALFAYQNL